MKNLNKILLGGVAFSLVLSSCSIEKRVHNPGYHISWKNGKHSTHQEKENAEGDERIVMKPATSNEKVEENQLKAEESAMLAVVATETKAAETQVVENPEVKTVSRSAEKTVQTAETKLNRENTKQLASKSSHKVKQLASKKAAEKEIKQPADDRLILLYILAILIPVIAVGIVTDWSAGPVLLSILLMILFYLPAIIHALIVVHNNA